MRKDFTPLYERNEIANEILRGRIVIPLIGGSWDGKTQAMALLNVPVQTELARPIDLDETGRQWFGTVGSIKYDMYYLRGVKQDDGKIFYYLVEETKLVDFTNEHADRTTN